jgi:hypothetical protein
VVTVLVQPFLYQEIGHGDLPQFCSILVLFFYNKIPGQYNSILDLFLLAVSPQGARIKYETCSSIDGDLTNFYSVFFFTTIFFSCVSTNVHSYTDFHIDPLPKLSQIKYFTFCHNKRKKG